ncbi:uncharacterized protein LOC120076412 isoform X1 [Benincasa hispida]|uniref:uncharacterized protein LOC120076412 isoform X1 n=2 Tax=Benincasa hispida TaxID=102211 RepID=UPI0019007943|nr:uncharacterized protein LOC120076412 isoform X1 [Benincasa hispida]
MSPSAVGSFDADGGCDCRAHQNGDAKAPANSKSGDSYCEHCGCGSADSSSFPSFSCSSSSLWLDSTRLRESGKLWRILVASAKGFTIGAGLKGGLSLFSVLAGLKRRKALASLGKKGVITNRDAISMALKETLRYGLFLGTFAGTFVSIDEIVGNLGGHRRTASWRALLAGALAGPSMLLTGLNTQHKTLAIYIFMRAAVLASRCGIKSKRFGHICKPLTWSYGDIFLMCLSSSQILSAYVLKQDSLPPSFRSFLNTHGGKDTVILEGLKSFVSGMPSSNKFKAIEKYYSAMGANVRLNLQMKTPCMIIHGNQSCGGHFLSFLIRGYKRALPVYLPVYLIPALIVHREGLMNRPYEILARGLLGTARSSLFLSAYCASAWMWTCLTARSFKKINIPLVAVATFLTGLALAIEKKSRRIEISLYCLARGIESFFSSMTDLGYLPPSLNFKRADVIVFSISTSIIMHCYAQEREVFRSKYLNVLDWVFGVPPPPCETPRCKNGKQY